MAAGVSLLTDLPHPSPQAGSGDLNRVNSMNTVSGGVPTARYTKMGETLRHVIPGHMQCSMACGGRGCKYENPARWRDEDQAVKGIYSSWITDNLLAMARPSTEIIEKYNVIEQFQRYGLRTVINLQRPGEHASCGNSLEQDSGFTYRPEIFMEAGIYFYNFGWKDYGVASLTTILDMVKVMSFAIQEGKMAVHCHAGLGRTGVLLACYLVFTSRMSADQAILFVRAKRPNSIQTRGQLLCVREFAQFLVPLRNVFSCAEPRAHTVTLSQYLTRQRHLLHGYEARQLKNVPKIVQLVCKVLLDIASNRQVVEEVMVEVPDLTAEVEKMVSQQALQLLGKEMRGKGIPVPSLHLAGPHPETTLTQQETTLTQQETTLTQQETTLTQHGAPYPLLDLDLSPTLTHPESPLHCDQHQPVSQSLLLTHPESPLPRDQKSLLLTHPESPLPRDQKSLLLTHPESPLPRDQRSLLLTHPESPLPRDQRSLLLTHPESPLPRDQRSLLLTHPESPLARDQRSLLLTHPESPLPRDQRSLLLTHPESPLPRDQRSLLLTHPESPLPRDQRSLLLTHPESPLPRDQRSLLLTHPESPLPRDQGSLTHTLHMEQPLTPKKQSRLLEPWLHHNPQLSPSPVHDQPLSSNQELGSLWPRENQMPISVLKSLQPGKRFLSFSDSALYKLEPKQVPVWEQNQDLSWISRLLPPTRPPAATEQKPLSPQHPARAWETPRSPHQSPLSPYPPDSKQSQNNSLSGREQRIDQNQNTTPLFQRRRHLDAVQRSRSFGFGFTSQEDRKGSSCRAVAALLALKAEDGRLNTSPASSPKPALTKPLGEELSQGQWRGERAVKSHTGGEESVYLEQTGVREHRQEKKRLGDSEDRERGEDGVRERGEDGVRERRNSVEREDVESRKCLEEVPVISLHTDLSLKARHLLVARALAVNQKDEDLQAKISVWQRELNSREGAWERLQLERDPVVLAGLMWSWLEQLKEPIISSQDIQTLGQNNFNSQNALTCLEKGQRLTLLCILDCAAHLVALPDQVETDLLKRTIEVFTKIHSESDQTLYQMLTAILTPILHELRKKAGEEMETTNHYS
ncbi:protein tyrosine phosphatase domain-containing protein 1 isoform X1 [Esox lucius]|uniref:Protein tyrosine phosphatase domain-containing protein 1 n=1 Tax=Esox lucius TaxID=8010 RepID=A0A3P9A1L6_ESOLU|nr:protein tyrosine phosphatase domain-containing protein 1 isoform X1 [Esox lucius]